VRELRERDELEIEEEACTCGRISGARLGKIKGGEIFLQS
jgi:hypothetical protein